MKTYTLSHPLEILFFRENSYWVAQERHIDLNAIGSTLEEARNNLLWYFCAQAVEDLKSDSVPWQHMGRTATTFKTRYDNANVCVSFGKLGESKPFRLSPEDTDYSIVLVDGVHKIEE